jgi:hypothetical protein
MWTTRSSPYGDGFASGVESGASLAVLRRGRVVVDLVAGRRDAAQ